MIAGPGRINGLFSCRSSYPAPAPISRAAIALSFSSRALRALSDSAVSCAVGGAANSLARRSMMASTRSVAGLSPAMALA